jgi:hypothetical protein
MTNNARLRNAALLALGLATVAHASGCAVDAVEAGEEAEIVDEGGDGGGEPAGPEVNLPATSAELSPEVCEPTIRGAAITKQISHLDDNAVDLELVTLSMRPFLYDATAVTGPEGMNLLNLRTECVPSGADKWRCAHSFTIDAGERCTASGQYKVTVSPVPDGSACAGFVGADVIQTLTIATENLCPIEIDGGDEPQP